jgi:hypothetical protein
VRDLRVVRRPDILPGVEKSFTVTAFWDAEAEVFTTESDIPGLVVEAAMFEELVELVRSLAPRSSRPIFQARRRRTRFKS